ncbi:hypothetical protein LTR08_004183 [Meristemomyces frigidus]|nr:hypothetical protein LTR08_004183 [Meristemomyces frigidus]
MWDAVSYKSVKFNLDPQNESAFRGPVRPELDEAWGNVSASNLIQIDREGMMALGQPLDAFNLDGQYFAIVDVFHQLHCVEMIGDHCFDMLRQKIMCDVDIGLIFYRADTDVVLDAEFDLERQCRDFEPVQQWVFDHDVQRETYDRLHEMARENAQASKLAEGGHL